MKQYEIDLWQEGKKGDDVKEKNEERTILKSFTPPKFLIPLFYYVLQWICLPRLDFTHEILNPDALKFCSYMCVKFSLFEEFYLKKKNNKQWFRILLKKKTETFKATVFIYLKELQNVKSVI